MIDNMQPMVDAANETTTIKCHVLLYPIFEYWLDLFNVQYDTEQTEFGVQFDENDKVYPGGYITYTILKKEEFFITNLLPYQPYEELEIQAILTFPNTETSRFLVDELGKYKPLKVVRVTVADGSSNTTYFYKDVRGKEKSIQVDYNKTKRDSLGNQPIRVKRK